MAKKNIPVGENDTRLVIMLPYADKKNLQEQAKSMRLTVAGVVRMIIVKYLKEEQK